jgi:hypothetical protein
MNINIQTIPHSLQRYETMGDWWFDSSGTLQIRVSEMGVVKYEILIALHEAVEAILCTGEGMDSKVLDDFDQRFEALREREPDLLGLQEPGDMVSAPYHKQHTTANAVEHFAADAMGVDFQSYEDMVNSVL